MVRLRPTLAAALLDGLFEHPAEECKKLGGSAFVALILALSHLTAFLPDWQLSILFHGFWRIRFFILLLSEVGDGPIGVCLSAS